MKIVDCPVATRALSLENGETFTQAQCFSLLCRFMGKVRAEKISSQLFDCMEQSIVEQRLAIL